ncbi:Histone-lysine N-methyltransferase SETMAR [Eumeta japonica]|uniref:Histone-lysine N-methyltransferase SETMAR n=1 Tax=Eumeta variegata TaxID=151549 RepID=A0A4C1XD82_EUMVA|nr:Histone-lysine N-methyltransferase SETMAR [Eumeta japonica]
MLPIRKLGFWAFAATEKVLNVLRSSLLDTVKLTEDAQCLALGRAHRELDGTDPFFLRSRPRQSPAAAPALIILNSIDDVVWLKKITPSDRQVQRIRSYDIAAELGIAHKTVLAHSKEAGYTKKPDTGVPHELTERNLMDRVLICDCLLKRDETEPFLKRLISGDEKWITYDKNVRHRSLSKGKQAPQTITKPGLRRHSI